LFLANTPTHANNIPTMFYTKYRPRKFGEFLGSETLSRAIQNSIFSKNFAHAFFLYGPRGVGKTTMARLIAKALNCQKSNLSNLTNTPNLTNSEPCGTCDHCIAIDNGSYIDLIEIDAASNRGIDDVRSLRDKIALSPAAGRFKVYIIDEVHMLTNEAFNALLKTLEEPPPHAVFVLCTTEFKKVPETIRSRCQQFELKRATVLDIVKKLKRILDAEQKEKTPVPELSDESLKKIAKAALGGFRDAETMLEQVVFGQITVDELIALSDTDELAKFVYDIAIKPNTKVALEYLEKTFETGIGAESWTDSFLEYLQSLLFAKVGAGNDALLIDPIKVITLPQISGLIKSFGEARRQIRFATIPFLPLEVAVVDLTEELNRVPPFRVEPESILSAPSSPPNPPAFSIEKLYEAVRPLNHSVEALLRSCKILGFDDDNESLVIEAFYSFHRERLNSPTNKKIVETALEKILGRAVAIKVTLSKQKPASKEDLSDKNIEPIKGVVPPDKIKEAWEVLDGKAPL